MKEGNVGGTARRRGGRQQLSEEVASYVRELIISGDIKPGEFVRTESIQEAVGVSNTPVREGMLSLRNEGFVELVPRRGFVVAPFAEQDLSDLFWVQGKLAGELAARAAKSMTHARLEILEGLLERYQGAVDRNDASTVADLGHEFHRQINLAADSRRLAILLGAVVKQLPNRFYASIERQVAATSQEHHEIVDALRKRDSRRASLIMETHVASGAARLIESLPQQDRGKSA
ncbi:MAG: GntR family transcriptional regulator [Rhodococcus sp. (in: high G+C Gram-positive bacteria)]|nr:MAG: GntR family transcriptional regulator [Rhodococcus sp. (in: high G+C Gram-positive bacteria)]